MTGFAYIPADVGPPVTENAMFKLEVAKISPAPVFVINSQVDLEALDIGIPEDNTTINEHKYYSIINKQASTGTSTVSNNSPPIYKLYLAKNYNTAEINSLKFEDRHRR